MEYKPFLMNEIYVCTKHIGFSYSDTLRMPVWERRNYIQQLMEEVERENKEIAKQSKVSSSGGGKRTTRVST